MIWFDYLFSQKKKPYGTLTWNSNSILHSYIKTFSLDVVQIGQNNDQITIHHYIHYILFKNNLQKRVWCNYKMTDLLIKAHLESEHKAHSMTMTMTEYQSIVQTLTSNRSITSGLFFKIMSFDGWWWFVNAGSTLPFRTCSFPYTNLHDILLLDTLDTFGLMLFMAVITESLVQRHER